MIIKIFRFFFNISGKYGGSKERRLEVVFEHKSGKNIRDIAKKLVINKNTVSNIVKKHKSTGLKDLPGRGRKSADISPVTRKCGRKSVVSR